MLFDSHAHYNDERFNDDRDELLLTMQENNVGLIMNSCSDTEEIPDIISLCQSYDFIYGSVGVHPHCVEHMTNGDMDLLKKYSKHQKIKAIGEIGLDYYYDNSPRDKQREWFSKQLDLAVELDMPIVIHDRDAHGDCMDILRGYKGKIRGEFHCYAGSKEMAKEILDWGMYLAMGGALTFKNSVRPREVAEYVPMDRILIETDCPYLTPVPHRGKRNSSLYIHYVAKEIARLKGIDEKTVEDMTFENAKKMFNIK